jgi:hypothetical protein
MGQVERLQVRVGGGWIVMIVASAIAFPIGGDVVTLSGTSGSPNYATDTASVALAGWRFNSDGTVDKMEGGSAFQFNSTTEWVIPNVYGNGPYWIRYTEDSGATANWISNSAKNTWLALTSDRIWQWTSNIGIRTGAGKVEIAKDSGGSNIVATGYYGGDIEGGV